MVQLSFSSSALSRVDVDVLAIGVRQGRVMRHSFFKKTGSKLKTPISRLVSQEEFAGKRGETLMVPVSGILRARKLLLVGLGKNEPTTAGWRAFASKAGSYAKNAKSLGIELPSQSPDIVRAIAEGAESGAYRFTRYLTGDRIPKRKLEKVVFWHADRVEPAASDAADAGQIVAQAMNLARDLVNCPPNDMTPVALANVAKDLSKKTPVSCRVYDVKQLKEMGCNLLLAVGQGSENEPRMIHLTYRPKGEAIKKVALVGKGITFDSGGLCLKPSKSMVDMKCDMSGSAVTLATMAAISLLGLPIEVHAIVAAAENMPSGFAYRPGDVFTSMDGRTVEIINTDAEGRLALADALTYARGLEPDVIVDHATLTGACMVALGTGTAGLYSSEESVADEYLAAAKETGESYWRMPLTESLKDSLRSDVADLKHTGEAYGGSITAALFLREFVGDVPWAHLDIAGPSFADRAKGIYPRGGTGFGVLTAIRWLEGLTAS